MTRRALVLCTGNSCRSVMAEALWRHHGAPEWEVFSAGSRPTGSVHPLALEVLGEKGIDTRGLESRSVDGFRGQPFDLVVTVCDAAREECPAFPGAGGQAHWPFADPAEATGSPEQRKAFFVSVRDAVEARILEFLRRDTLAERLRGWLAQTLEQAVVAISDDDRERYVELTERTARRLPLADPWREIPGWIQELFASRGWEWNGIYERSGDRLRLWAAAGPPVCVEIERCGEEGSSGMCFDALLLNQTLVARQPLSWPGYVSCDGESGLVTVAGLVCPIRGGDGRPLAVWDLDSTQALEPSDPFFFDRFFATLSALLRPVSLDGEAAPPPDGAGARGSRHDRELIKLDQFLKRLGLVETGGRAKLVIQEGQVMVNGEVERRRGKRLRPGDRVHFEGTEHVVT